MLNIIPALLPANVPSRPVRRYRTICDGVLDFANDWRGPKFHALLCDPPYHLTSITKRFGANGAAPAQFGKDGAFSRASRGFMGKQWDGGDTAFNPETWAAFADLLLPGAFGMAFASSRGWHRLAVAIEDAGLIIHPSIFGWGFGSGFPKATRIPDERFEGYRYGLQALKPALEPIIVFQKPYEDRPIDCITNGGAGALWIDGGRIAGEAWSRSTPWKNDIRGGNYVTSHGHIMEVEPQNMADGGRWPANLVLVHDPRCTRSCVPECPVRRLGEQTGPRDAGSSVLGTEPSRTGKNVYRNHKRVPFDAYDDSGTASRFFHNADWSYEIAEQIAMADPVRYEPKASADERERGLEHMRRQTVNDGRQTAIDNAYQRGETEGLNPHPTVKPIALTEWLAKILLPPSAYAPRRILIPFAGSGSEMIGALKAGWDHIVGVERDTEYAIIARARLRYYADPLAAMRPSQTDAEQAAGQVTLFDWAAQQGAMAK